MLKKHPSLFKTTSAPGRSQRTRSRSPFNRIEIYILRMAIIILICLPIDGCGGGGGGSTGPGGSGGAPGGGHVAVSNPPVINSVDPVSGTVGDQVVIRGAHFNPAPSKTNVKFNGTPAKILSVQASQLTVIVPKGASTGPISVETDEGETTTPGNFTVLAGNKVFLPNSSGNTVSVIDASNNSLYATIVVGSNPSAVAVDAQSNRSYVANSGSGTVSVIETTNNSVVASIPVGPNPSGIVINPLTNMIYVVNTGNGTVSVIDGVNLKVISVIQVGILPQGIGIDPLLHRIYVANSGDKTVSIIDTNTNTVVATISVGFNPFQVAINPVTHQVYVTDSCCTNLAIINPTLSTFPVTTIQAGRGQGAIAVNPFTGNIYVANPGSGTVTVISPPDDSGGGGGVTTIPVGANPKSIQINLPTNQAFVVCQDALTHLTTVFVIDLATNKVVNQIAVPASPTGKVMVTNFGSGLLSVVEGDILLKNYFVLTTPAVGKNPEEIAVNPLTNRAYVTNLGDGTLSVVDTVTNNVINTIQIASGVQVQEIAVNPPNNRVYVTVNNNTVVVVDTVSNTVRATINVPDGARGIEVDSQGNRLYVTGNLNLISVIDTANDHNTIVARITVGNGPDEITLDAPSHRAYVANIGSGTLSVIDTVSNTVISTVSPFSPSLRVTWQGIAVDATANRLYLSSNVPDSSGGGTQGQITVLDTSTPAYVMVANLLLGSGTDTGDAAISTATHRLYVSNPSRGSVTVIDTSTNTLVTSVSVALIPSGLAVVQ